MHSGTLILRIDSQLDHVFLVGVAVRGVCAAARLDDEQANAIELCVVEAVNNAIEHAYSGEPGHPVEIAVEIAGGAMQVEVRDRGSAMDWAAACARADGYAADRLAEGGRGVFIMRSLMDRLTYRSADGWNVLTLIKQLPEAVPAPEMPRPS